MHTSRRAFIKQAGLGAVGALLSNSLLSACSGSKSIKGDNPLANIGLQLFTLRDLLFSDAKTTLETISKIGYSHIETFGLDLNSNSFWGLELLDLKKIMDDNNLKTYSGHYDMSKYLSKNHSDKESIEKYVEVAAALGQKYIIAPTNPMFDLNALTSDDYKYAAEQLNKAGEAAKKAGIKVGYHNHFWELRQFGNTTRGLDILLAFTEKDLVAFELDIFWLEKAGFSALTYFEKYPGRFELWHVKDMDRNFTKPIVGGDYDDMPLDSIFKEVRYTEVGTGTIDYLNITQEKTKAGLQYAFVEQDDIYVANKFESVKKSYDYVQKFLTK